MRDKEIILCVFIIFVQLFCAFLLHFIKVDRDSTTGRQLFLFTFHSLAKRACQQAHMHIWDVQTGRTGKHCRKNLNYTYYLARVHTNIKAVKVVRFKINFKLINDA